MTLTKRDLVLHISARTGLVQQDVTRIVQLTLDHITETLAAGDKVELRQFGVFDIAIRKPRMGRNPKVAGSEVAIPRRIVVKFKSGKEMRARVAKLSARKVVAHSAARKRPLKKQA